MAAGLVAICLASAGFAQQQTTGSDAPARPAIPFPATPTPKPKEEPMTPEKLDQHLVPSEFLGRTSDVLALVYSGFRRSQVDPCGCVTHQLGGLDKEARLVKRIDELNVPAIQLDAGGFIRDMGDEKAINQSKFLLKGLGQIGYNAINVGYTDLSLSPADLKAAADEAGVKLVSANITDQSGQLAFDPYIVEEVKLTDGSNLKVGVVGVTRPRVEVAGANPTPAPGPGAVAGAAVGGATVTNPLEAINKYVPEVAEKADFVVILSYDRRSNADKIIGGINDKNLVDVLIMGENNQIQGTVQAIDNIQVVSGGYEGRQLGTLYVELNDEQNVASTWNKHIEVLQTIPPVAEITKIIEEVHGADNPAGSAGTTSTAPAATPAAPAKLDLGT
jgi:2',3'-cyclic-nucleotide 2'-phosphodiesterase (5'-nucleotidase family)